MTPSPPVRPAWSAAIAACLAACTGPAPAGDAPGGAPPASRRPNLILIVADDLGYAEIGVQGNRDVPTPNIDSLARGGVRFTNGYVSCPVCSPTRAGLMTGRYQQRFGHEFNPGRPDAVEPQFGLRASERIVPEYLKAAGYVTGMFGKWHLGYREDSRPVRRGFDEFFGFLGGAHPYLGADPRRGNPLMRGNEPAGAVDYTTDAFARAAAAFVERNRERPFFLYLPFNAVHSPLEATPAYLSRFAHIADRNRRTFAAMLSAMDDGVGLVLAKLREAGLEENTLIVFHSDNGGPTPMTTSRNDPLRGRKSEVYEGGIRVPFLAQWKGRLPAGKVDDRPVIALDVLPTFLAAAGAPPPAGVTLDGADLLPHLTGKNDAPPHDRLFWRYGKQWAVRMGDWKLLDAGDGRAELYQLREDIGETTDVAAKLPEKAAELRAAYDAWAKDLMPPRWGGRGGAKKPRRAAQKKL